MKEYNELLWFDLRETLRSEGTIKLDFKLCLDVSKLDVWLNVFDLKLGALAWSWTKLKENPPFDLKK